MATDRRFTGQREEAAIGLYDYKARYYDPVIGRFIQADTIVPEPGNPQALNRYAYVYGNPLRYTDPTGYYSEDEIMQAFGVESWDQVLAHFQEGGTLAGLWGWLEVLRHAQDGDFVSHDVKPKFAPPGPSTGWDWGDPYNGAYFKRGAKGQILVDGVHHGSFATSSGSIYSLWRQDARESSVWGYQFLTSVGTKHYHIGIKEAKDIDWIDAGMDIAGILVDIPTVGSGGRMVNGLQVSAIAVGNLLDVGGMAYSTGIGVDDGALTNAERIDIVLAAWGTQIPILPDAVSLGINVLEITP